MKPKALYQATVPDTLDLAERAELALYGMGATLDPALDYLPYGSVTLASRTPLLAQEPGLARAHDICAFLDRAESATEGK